MEIIDFIFRRIPFYVLYVVSYGFMIVTLYIYGQMSSDHVYFLLLWLSIITFIFSFIFYLFYEIEDKFTVEELKSIFYCAKRGIITPFFVLGLLSSINYILVAIANPYVESLDQVLASILQLPIVILFNRLLNNEYLWNSNVNKYKQLILWFFIASLFLFGVLLTSWNEINSKFSNFGWFLCYLISTFPLPMLSVFYQSLVTINPVIKLKQSEFKVYSKRSLIIAMLNFWQLIWLLITIWLIPYVDGTNIKYSINSGLKCVFNGNSNDTNDECNRLFFDLSMLTFCVIFNFYAGIKVVTFDDANFAILIQQLGPILAAFMFSSKTFMGSYYDLQTTTWRSYVAIASIILSFSFYKYFKLYIQKADNNNNNEIDNIDIEYGTNIITKNKHLKNKKRTMFEKIWVLDSVFDDNDYSDPLVDDNLINE